MLRTRSRRHPSSLKRVKRSRVRPSLIADESNANITRGAINNYLTSVQTRCEIGGVPIDAKVQLIRNTVYSLSVHFQRTDSLRYPLPIFIIACETYAYDAKFSTRHKDLSQWFPDVFSKRKPTTYLTTPTKIVTMMMLLMMMTIMMMIRGRSGRIANLTFIRIKNILNANPCIGILPHEKLRYLYLVWN